MIYLAIAIAIDFSSTDIVYLPIKTVVTPWFCLSRTVVALKLL